MVREEKSEKSCSKNNKNISERQDAGKEEKVIECQRSSEKFRISEKDKKVCKSSEVVRAS